MGEEPDLDRIKRLLADAARTAGRPEGELMGRAAVAAGAASPLPPACTTDAAAVRLATATAWIRAREERDRVFGGDLFFDPAWNMLLDLYVNERRGALVSVSSLCIAANVPSTTALRWLTMLEKRGLVGRRADDYDRRRSFLFLTEDARSKVELALDRAEGAKDRLTVGALNRLN